MSCGAGDNPAASGQAVSVCVPTYNGASHLRECLDSVLAQTCGSFEVLVVDDCSSDDTVAIAEAYARADRRVRLLRNERNLGLVGNWNRCVELARGDWVKFVFQDDLIRPHCLERMLAIAHRPIAFCHREFLFDEADEATMREYRAIPLLRDLLGPGSDFTAEAVIDAAMKRSSNFFGEPTAALVHRSMFGRFGTFNPDIKQIPDLEYWIRVASNTGMSYTEETLASFRVHAGSTSAKNRDATLIDRVSLYDELLVLHAYAYEPQYRNLRRLAARRGVRRNFKLRFAKRAAWMRARSIAEARRPGTPDARWLDQWNSLAPRYPHLSRSWWQIPFRIRALWDRHFAWRMGQG